MEFSEILGIIYLVAIICLLVALVIWLVYCELVRNKNVKQFMCSLSDQDKLLIQKYKEANTLDINDVKKKKKAKKVNNDKE